MNDAIWTVLACADRYEHIYCFFANEVKGTEIVRIEWTRLRDEHGAVVPFVHVDNGVWHLMINSGWLHRVHLDVVHDRYPVSGKPCEKLTEEGLRWLRKHYPDYRNRLVAFLL